MIAENNIDNYRPKKFPDTLRGNNPIILLYDNQRYANLVISRYLLNGLEKGRSCVFFTSDNPKDVEKRLYAVGIDVDSYKKKDSLRIFVIEKSDENKKLDIIGTLRSLRKEPTIGMRPLYRFVGRTITDTKSEEGMKTGLDLEKLGHEHLEFDNSQMCYYDIYGIDESRRDEWIRGLIKNHHHVIYASNPDRAVAFETALLTDAGE